MIARMNAYETDGLFAVMVQMSLLGFIFYFAVGLLRRLLTALACRPRCTRIRSEIGEATMQNASRTAPRARRCRCGHRLSSRSAIDAARAEEPIALSCRRSASRRNSAISSMPIRGDHFERQGSEGDRARDAWRTIRSSSSSRAACSSSATRSSISCAVIPSRT